jgi:bacterial/archaeal transporter family-2 protein
MTILGLFTLAVFAGVTGTCQVAANTALAGRAGLGAALVLNTTVVWLGAFVFLWLTGGPRTLAALPGAPPHHYLGGLFGFAVIASITYVFPRLGASVSLALMVLGQGAMALAVDHYGLWGMRSVEVTGTRLMGIGFLVIGIVLLRR